MTYSRSGIAQYQQVGNQAASYADPYQLICMLFDGALDRIAQARGAMERGETAVKGERISKAIGIIGGLRDALDVDKGGELAENLAGLYDYMERTLMMANARNEVAKLDEVASLLREIKEAWDAIPMEARNQGSHGTVPTGTAG